MSERAGVNKGVYYVLIASLVAVIGIVAYLLVRPSEASAAERRYDVVVSSGAGASERCRAAREVQAAHLRSENEEGYLRWTIRVNTECGV